MVQGYLIVKVWIVPFRMDPDRSQHHTRSLYRGIVASSSRVSIYSLLGQGMGEILFPRRFVVLWVLFVMFSPFILVIFLEQCFGDGCFWLSFSHVLFLIEKWAILLAFFPHWGRFSVVLVEGIFTCDVLTLWRVFLSFFLPLFGQPFSLEKVGFCLDVEDKYFQEDEPFDLLSPPWHDEQWMP